VILSFFFFLFSFFFSPMEHIIFIDLDAVWICLLLLHTCHFFYLYFLTFSRHLFHTHRLFFLPCNFNCCEIWMLYDFGFYCLIRVTFFFYLIFPTPSRYLSIYHRLLFLYLSLLARDYLQLLKMVGKFIDHCLNFPTIFAGEQ